MVDWSKTSLTFRLVLMALMVALMVATDEAFAAIPFLQFVTFLVVLNYVLFGYTFTISVLLIYITMDCLISGGMWPLFISIPTMFLAWAMLPTMLLLTKLINGSFYKKLWLIALITGLHGFIYGQTFAVVTTLIYNGETFETFRAGWMAWTMGDIPWEVGQCIMGIASVVILLPIVYKALEKPLTRYAASHRTKNDEIPTEINSEEFPHEKL